MRGQPSLTTPMRLALLEQHVRVTPRLFDLLGKRRDDHHVPGPHVLSQRLVNRADLPAEFKSELIDPMLEAIHATAEAIHATR